MMDLHGTYYRRGADPAFDSVLLLLSPFSFLSSSVYVCCLFRRFIYYVKNGTESSIYCHPISLSQLPSFFCLILNILFTYT